jgi:HEAT repeat protein
LAPYLESEDPTIRGLAALVAGRLGARELRPTMERLLVDEAEFAVFHDDRFESHKVGKLAQQGIALLDERG